MLFDFGLDTKLIVCRVQIYKWVFTMAQTGEFYTIPTKEYADKLGKY